MSLTIPRGHSITTQYDSIAFSKLVKSYMMPPPTTVKRAKRAYRATLITGSMGSGKTTFVKAKLGEIVAELLEQGVDEREVCYIYAQESKMERIIEVAKDLDLSKCLYLYIFNDDAAVPAHGRRAMSEENVNESKQYVMIRHRLYDLGFSGYLHVVHATQVYYLIDVSFRRTAGLKLFKDYPDEPNDFKIIGRMLGKAGLEALFRLSLKLYVSNDPAQMWEAVHEAVSMFKKYRSLVRARPNNIIDEVSIQKVEVVNREHATNNSIEVSRVAVHVLKRILSRANIESRGANVVITFPNNTRLWLRKHYLESLGIRFSHIGYTGGSQYE